MTYKGEAFSDLFAQKENWITGIEPRIKIAFTVIALVINLLAASIYAPITIAAFCFAILLSIRIPPRLLLLRLAMPMAIATVVFITQLFFYGATPLFTLSLWGLHLMGYEEGLARGLLIMSRVIAGISLILFLSMSTPANKLLMAAGWFKVPKTFIELALLTYRYVFVLLEEMETIRGAQKVRLGYHGWRQSMRALGVLGSSLIFRAYDRADRVYEAMLARGYSGTMAINYRQNFTRRDYLVSIGLGATLLFFYLTGQLGT